MDDNCANEAQIVYRCQRATLNPTRALHDHVRKARGAGQYRGYLAVNIAGSWHCHAYANDHCPLSMSIVSLLQSVG